MMQVASMLLAEDFYDPAHSIVYSAMIDLYARNRPIDSLTVREVIDDQKKLDSIGGDNFL
jgi:replicative DNA helicase